MRPIQLRIGDLAFTWDPTKHEQNIQKHGISFEEAATTWFDEFAIEQSDESHSQNEPRWLRIGVSLRGAHIVVWHTERNVDGEDVIRLIGARRATKREKRLYDKTNRK